MSKSLILLFYLIIQLSKCEINIDVSRNLGKFKQFWKSTGLCPPDPKNKIHEFLLSDEEKINFALIGSLPNNGISQVRIHWLINLITQRETGSAYNFTYLDDLLAHLHKYSLRPGMEIMGYPIILNNPDRLMHKSDINWTDMVEQIATRYLKKYGKGEVKKWRFESWNEPDLKTYNVLNFTVSEYLQYVDDCAEGLRKGFNYNFVGKFGGPAGLFRDYSKHPFCWGLLEKCANSDNCPIQFWSFHRKGDGTAEGVLNATLQFLDEIEEMFPELKRKLRIANDEADLMKTWSKPEEWRADARYAANVVAVIAGYYKSVHLQRQWNIEVLSNDNGFLNYHPHYFTQRTLFARFQMNGTRPPHVQFIKKPVYAVMGLLSFLKGESLMKKDEINQDQLVTVLATKNEKPQNSASILLAYSNGTESDSTNERTKQLVINNIWAGDGKYVIYAVNNIDTDPYLLWRRHGMAPFPDEHVRRAMRAVEEPLRLIEPTDFTGPKIDVSIKLSIPSVALLHLCMKDEASPAKVTKLSLTNITRNEILITWSYNSKHATTCIKTYEVEQRPARARSSQRFRRINVERDTIFLSYHHAVTDCGCECTVGEYRVRAVDYWERPGRYSEIVRYPPLPPL